ncbi:MAG: xanthorhodopsin, partial [Planctomycetaceae bacterium]|nr:xanthorhodopsin [Planctomycetaceae bacterium]
VVGLQVGYAIADMAAKAGFGVLIYFIARAKTQQDAADGISPDAIVMPA